MDELSMDEQPKKSLPVRMLTALSRRLRLRRTSTCNDTTQALPSSELHHSRLRLPRLKRSTQALREALDVKTPNNLVHETFELTLDLQQLHQQLRNVARKKASAPQEATFLLPKFSFESTPNLPSELGRTQLREPPPVYSHSRLPSYTTVDVTSNAMSKQYLELLAEHPALRPSTPHTLRRKPVALSEPLLGALQEKLDNHMLETAYSRDSSILVPRDLYLNGLRRVGRGEVPANPIGSPRR